MGEVEVGLRFRHRILLVLSLFMSAYKKCGSTPAFNVNLEVSLSSRIY